MKLFLASRIHTPESITKLKEYVGRFEGRKIAYIPTASNGENDWEYWKIKRDGTWRYVNTLGAKVKAVVLENYRDKSVVKELKDQDIIWFAGGMAGYLAYWMRRCSLDIYLPQILKETGVYVGSSAGAMVAGKSLQLNSLRHVDGELGAETIKPMNFVSFDILPHYEEEYLPEIKRRYKCGKLYLLKDGEEIIVEDDKITVVGEERIILKQ